MHIYLLSTIYLSTYLSIYPNSFYFPSIWQEDLLKVTHTTPSLRTEKVALFHSLECNGTNIWKSLLVCCSRLLEIERTARRATQLSREYFEGRQERTPTYLVKKRNTGEQKYINHNFTSQYSQIYRCLGRNQSSHTGTLNPFSTTKHLHIHSAHYLLILYSNRLK